MRPRLTVRRCLLCAAFAVASVLSAGPLQAQLKCNLVPGTGCSGIGPFACGDRAGIGQVLGGACEIAGFYVLLLGGCASSPIWIPLCCSLGVDPAAMIMIPVHGPWSVPIPFDPRLIGAVLCHQCYGLPLCTNQDIRAAVRVTITP